MVLPMNDTQIAAASKWFSKKAQVNAIAALKDLALSEAVGGWIPGASRRVRAALSKHNVAAKTGKKLDTHPAGWAGFGLTRDTLYAPENQPVQKSLFNLYMAMTYGSHGGVVDFQALSQAATNADETKAVADGHEFVLDMTPVWETMRKLDNMRPKPTFTYLGVSPTITKTLTECGLDLNLESIRLCPMDYKEVTVNGKTHFVAYLVWPEGTVHGASRFHATNKNAQCQACGHAIKNAFNWVPLLIDGKDGKPYSMWVGRDCAKSVFGIEMTGELEIANR